ncbi:MAG: hypothetical protein J2P28_12190, partial [Actinobacteria bacterium]|nr:hypothetical protein [Actinomycetota bacterium]
MALAVSLPVIALDQFLHTPVANYGAQPVTEAMHWITDSLMAVPFFAVGAWAGDVIAARAKIGTAKHLDVRSKRLALFKRSLLIALVSALALAPAWFAVNKFDNPSQAQPLVVPTAHNSGDVYSVPPGVIVALVCACLIPAALWAGRAIARVMTYAKSASLHAAVTGATVQALLAAAVPILAWLIYHAASNAYASQVYYPRTPVAAVRRLPPASVPPSASHAGPAPHLPSAPNALVSQAAHALQDGLAGQAVGIPAAAVTATALLRAKVPRYRGKKRSTHRP